MFYDFCLIKKKQKGLFTTISGVKCFSNGQKSKETLSQRFNILIKKMGAYRFLMKQREHNRHMIKIIIVMDDQTYGCFAIRFWPKPPLTLRGMPYIFQFQVKRNVNHVYLGDISFSYTFSFWVWG